MSIPSIVLGGSAAIALAVSASAGMIYDDSANDLFDNGLANLDITSVSVTNDDYNIYFSVTTRGFSDWTKYGIMMGDSSDWIGTHSNPWGRPHNTNGQLITHFAGSWVDGGGGTQHWWYTAALGWSMADQYGNVVSGNTATFTVARGTLANGFTILFDVGTSGGDNNDPWVDLLSRSDQSTSGWGSGSTSGAFLSYTIVPAPGAIALMGLAGLISRRRR